MPDSVKIRLAEGATVSGLLVAPERPLACLVLAHGAGAGMMHPFMAAAADGLAHRQIATLRYQFPYMESGSKRPDRPDVAQATVRAAVDAATMTIPDVPLFAGGKSFGGRMTSQAQAAAPLPGVRGLIFFGYPLHPAGKPSDERGRHLTAIRIPMLFLQGTRDSLASMDLLVPLVDRLRGTATLWTGADADHSFHVPKRSGKRDEQVMDEVFDATREWVNSLAR